MIERTLRNSLFAVVLPLGLGLSISGMGCKKPTAADSANPSASGSAAAATPVAKGPCADYANKLCDKAGGSESATCQSIKTTTDLMPPEACSAGLKNVDFSVKRLSALRATCDELVKKLCEAVGEGSTCEMVKTKTKQFPPEQCKQMMEHLPEVVSSLKQMEESNKRAEEANKPLSTDLQATLVKDPGASFGPADSKVQIVEFSDFQCPYCARAAEVVEKIKEKYGTKVHFVFRQFPLSFHQNAKQAAEASLAAGSQGKFWDFHDRLFKNQSQLDREGLEQAAKAAGLNVAAFTKALDEHKFGPAVESDLKLGEQAHVQGTPTMFINGAAVPNPTSFEAVSALIDKAL